jgi:hypothetical protein
LFAHFTAASDIEDTVSLLIDAWQNLGSRKKWKNKDEVVDVVESA